MAALTAPPSRFALRGRIVTMAPGAAPIPDGVVYVDDGTISAVQPATAPRPDGFATTTPIRTSGTIYPGLIELHNHLAYDALPLWRVPAKYQNRAKWQGTKGAAKYVSGPASVLGSRPELIEATVRYVE